MSNFKGIQGHENQQVINDLVMQGRFKNTSWADIGKTIKDKFGIEISTPMLISYYKTVLNGDSLDKCKAVALMADDGSDSPENEGIKASQIDQDRLKELLTKYDKQGNNPLGALYAKIMALYESNLQAHTENKERLNSTYLKHLKELGSIIGQKKPNE